MQKQLMINKLKRRTPLGQLWPSLAFALYNVYTVLANLLPRPPKVLMQTGCLRCQPRELLSKLRKRRTPGPSRFFTKREYRFLDSLSGLQPVNWTSSVSYLVIRPLICPHFSYLIILSAQGRLSRIPSRKSTRAPRDGGSLAAATIAV